MGLEWLYPILDAVLGSLARSLLMAVSGFLLERHLVSQQIADQFVSDGIAHVLIAVPGVLAIAWSVWGKVRGRARFLTALQSAPGTTEDQVKDKVAAGMGASLKAGVLLLACVLGAAGLSSACASARPPAGTYSAAGDRAFDADQLFRAVQSLSETAINLNAAAGREHLSDRDTALVRDFALSAGAGLQSYADGRGSLVVVVDAYHELMRRLSTEASLNEKIRFALVLVDTNIGRIVVP